jgi:hypothetical protein
MRVFRNPSDSANFFGRTAHVNYISTNLEPLHLEFTGKSLHNLCSKSFFYDADDIFLDLFAGVGDNL